MKDQLGGARLSLLGHMVRSAGDWVMTILSEARIGFAKAHGVTASC